MADVSSGSWVGLPPADPNAPSRRRAAQPAQTGPAAAFGYTPTPERQASTGVNPGGAGYQSGQVAPTGQAMMALGIPQGGGTARGAVAPAGQGAGTAGATANPGGVTTGGYDARYPGGVPPAGDVTTTRSNLTSPEPSNSWGGQVAAPSTGDTTTTQSALSLSSPASSNQPGTTNTSTGTYSDPKIATTGNQAVDRAIDPGGLFSGATKTDTGPAVASQRAAFGLSDNLATERYNYRPGEAPSQDRVQLDTTQADQTRARQQAALDQLTGAANGTVPSAAEIQGQQQAGRDVAATLGQARALGGRSAGGAARAGTLASADILNSQRNSASAQRASEQANARNTLMSALGAVRGQDIDTSQSNANLAQSANANNLQAQEQTNQLAQQQRQALLDAQLKALGIGTGAAGSILQAGSANAAAQNKFNGGILDAFGNAIGSYGGSGG